MDSTWNVILLIAGLTALSFFFSLHNLAMRGASRAKLFESFEKAGKEKDLDGFLGRLEPLSLTCGFLRLLCNSGIILSLVHLFADKHYIVTFLVSAIIIETFTLAIPHSWSKHAGDYILPRTYTLLVGFYYLLKPILVLFELHDRLVRRLVGAPVLTPEEVKEEQFLSVVEQSKREGIVDEEEMDMIENVLELDDTTAEEIMTPRTDLFSVPVTASLQSLIDSIVEAGHSRIPVYENSIDNIIGILYVRDLLTEIGGSPETFSLRQKMRKPYFVPESKPLRDLLHEFKKQKLHIAVVLDEYGGTAGIVTIEDILEQVVGDINDEYDDVEAAAFQKINATTFEVDARANISDVNSELDIELPDEEDYDTLGGFVFSHLGYIPRAGQTFDYQGLHFTIIAAEARSVRRVRIETHLSPNKSQD